MREGDGMSLFLELSSIACYHCFPYALIHYASLSTEQYLCNVNYFNGRS